MDKGLDNSGAEKARVTVSDDVPHQRARIFSAMAGLS